MSGGLCDLMKDKRIRKKVDRMTDVLIKFLATEDEKAYKTLEKLVDKYSDQNTTGYYRSGPGRIADFMRENYLDRESPIVKREDIATLIKNMRGEKRIEMLGLLFMTHENAEALDIENIFGSEGRYDRLGIKGAYNKWMERLNNFIENHDFGCLNGTISMNEVERFMDYYNIDIWYKTEKK